MYDCECCKPDLPEPGVYCDYCAREVSGLIRERPPWYRRWFPYWVQRVLLFHDTTARREAMRLWLVEDVRVHVGPEAAAWMERDRP